MPRTPKPKGATSPFTGELATIYRTVKPYAIPSTLDGNFWRAVVSRQPLLGVLQTNIAMNVQSIPWDIRARDPKKADESKLRINKFRKILTVADGGWLNFISNILEDYYTVPFGAAVEATRYRNGELYSVNTLDGATMFPSYEPDYVAYQMVSTKNGEVVPFTENELYRVIYQPKREFQYYGWGMPPAERVYLTVELLARGDKYYGGLLLDTPEAGLLDLGDMSKESAESWIKSFQQAFGGIDGFKIPVIYEHTTAAKYIPFNRPPTEMMFADVTTKYAGLAAAAYGLTLSDIGYENGGKSLAGQIRSERNSRNSGYARARQAVYYLINSIIDEDLEFWWIDTNDEMLAAKGRARAANAIAAKNLIESTAFKPSELRQQMIADGLMNVPMPEEVEVNDFKTYQEVNGLGDSANTDATGPRDVRGGKVEQVTGKEPVPASQGGMGEIKFTLKPHEQVKIMTLVSRALAPILDATRESEDFQVWKDALADAIYDDYDHFEPEDREAIENTLKEIYLDILPRFDSDTWYQIELDFKPQIAETILRSVNEQQMALYVEGKLTDYVEQTGLVDFEETMVNADAADVLRNFQLEVKLEVIRAAMLAVLDDVELEDVLDIDYLINQMYNEKCDELEAEENGTSGATEESIE